MSTDNSVRGTEVGTEARALPVSLQLFLPAVQTELQHFALQVRLLHTLRAVLFTVVPKVTGKRKVQ